MQWSVFLILWPFWLLAEVLGVRWVVVVQRTDDEVRRERVRGPCGTRRVSLPFTVSGGS
ncbi:MAG: hypothetical protein U1D00_07030 [Mycobacterium sp.]|nr:hypothetical protein [Mycobacterium sp.]